MLASKATYLASLIPGEGQPAVLGAAATSPHAAVRVSAASALRNLDEHDADALAEQLISDVDVGVRKLTVRAAAGFDSARMTQRLQNVATTDSDETLRNIAAGALRVSRSEPRSYNQAGVVLSCQRLALPASIGELRLREPRDCALGQIWPWRPPQHGERGDHRGGEARADADQRVQAAVERRCPGGAVGADGVDPDRTFRAMQPAFS